MVENNLNSSQLPSRIALSFLTVVFIVAFFPVIKSLVETWILSDDHSHGLLILPVSFYIVWQKRDTMKNIELAPGGGGAFMVAFSISLYIFGYMAEISTISSLSLVLTIWATVWFLFGKEVFKVISFSMFFLLLMIPVPAQFYSMATIPLQLIVSKTSAFIGAFLGIPILREGNVLHLPSRTLAVVQACSGLRSLMSLITLCTIIGYISMTSNMLRGLLIISSVPAAIIVNIFRVVIMIAALQFFGFDLSKGMLHTIFGMVIFMLALLIMVLTRGILVKWDIKKTDV